MRFSLKKQQPPPPPSLMSNGADTVEGGILTDEESSYGPMPPPPPPPPLSTEVVAQKQLEYDEENAEIQNIPTKYDTPISQQLDTTQDITQDIDDDDEEQEPTKEPEEEEYDIKNLPEDFDEDEEETEIPDDDDAESVEIPPTSVVQRMIAEESFQEEKTMASSTLFRAGTLMTCCLLVLAIILGIGFGTGAFTQDSGTGSSTGNTENKGGIGNTTDTQRASDIQLYLSSISVVPENIQATNTAESKAVSWLIAEDPLSLGTESAADQFRLGQRYALLAFYYGSSKKWINETGWIVMEDECAWYGVTCEEQQINNATVNVVTAFVLTSNAINSKIPPDFVLLQALTILDVSENDMEQDLSSYNWKLMINLGVLRLNGNKFSGDISIFMDLPTTLQVLSIGGNSFTGTFPVELNGFREISELNIEKNQISGTISDVISDLNITTLRLGENNFDAAAFPIFIYTMTQLEVLGLGAVNINSEIEGALMNLVQLRVLELYNNPLNGTIPSVVLAMSSLEEFIANECQFNGPFPDISGWTSMKNLRLSDNDFTGSVPNTLNALGNLLSLQLDGNMLTGNLPTSITSLQNLEVLDLSKNPMSGVIPVDIGGLFSLRELKLNSMLHPDFPSAGLIGTIPTSIGSLARLEVLELRGNFLDGELPNTLGGLDALQVFDVQFNQLSGQIPEVVGNWNDTITYVELSNNAFIGSIPTSICGALLETMVADCDVNCTCCTSCV
jgi:Leucine-rich repeat (LRR) protein